MDFNLNLNFLKLSGILGRFHKLKKDYATERIILEKDTTPDAISNIYSILLKESKEKIGAINLLFDGEIWCYINKEFRNKGYATEAVEELIKCNKGEEFYLVIDFRNLPSIEVAEKLGFKYTGRNGDFLNYSYVS